LQGPRHRSNRHELTAELEKVLQQDQSAVWVDLLNAQGVPAGPILNMQQVFENEQVQHLGMSVTTRHPALGDIAIQGHPFVLSRTPGAPIKAAPDLGEHTDQILGELGYSPAEIAQFRDDKVV
jgi:crotonobetainyl-CoA:carnitine CoA-transferase CaiB-like acyl-CoA transferase